MQTPMLDQQRFRSRGAFALLGGLALFAVCFSQREHFSGLTGFVAAARSPATVNRAKFTHTWPDAAVHTPAIYGLQRKGDVSMMIDQVAAELANSGVTAEALSPAVAAAQQTIAATGGDFHTAVQAASSLLATNSGDFGGNSIPIIGLATLAATIAILAGPVED
jgi:hypothetical protein